ncbi:DUF2812 domain-containing protein [Priestia taiwanensis]|uniref:DUF2812 domain-containing protein n=1 Tax=Priestia taiwanensis TaxID=1347902 RepID=A0A917ANP3_9BACI|nr:DUF2812 domain-containing protein [Priestia taiwanensis]MBM7362480.1 hypothetical protein [Priestia taiwanensis]GGE62560.1 hypothetical protein GCM10007140_11030 [Priestia taiwanensis]
MKKVYKPLWSFDLLKTEQWLSDMALQGFHLVTFNRLSRCFYFEESVPKRVTYRIGFEKRNNIWPSTLLNEGWEKIVQRGGWYIAVNERPIDTIRMFPERESIVKRNQIIKYAFTGLFAYLVFLIISLSFGLIAHISGAPNVQESPYWAITYAAFFIAILLALFIHRCMKKINSNHYVMMPIHTTQHNSLPSTTRKQPTGEIITKIKFGWIHSPDKLEKWLEKMETNGFHLYRVGTFGITFYFVKDTPRTIRYCVDYQTFCNHTYTQIHEDAGWKQLFSSSASIDKWTIWSCEYADNEATPQMYYDKSEHLKQAKKVAIRHSTWPIPFITIMLFNMYSSFNVMLRDETYSISPLSISLPIIAILLFSLFIAKGWLYVLRLKKQHQN